MAGDRWGEIERAAEAGDTARVIDICLGLDESGRRKLSKQATALMRRLEMTEADWSSADFTFHAKPRRAAQAEAARAAAFCLGPPPTTRSFAQVPDERLEEVVRSRSRDWRNRWATRAIAIEWNFGAWPVLRTLIREGQCDKPDGPEYVRAMVRNAAYFSPHRPDRPDLHTALLQDPDLLEEDVWRIFELEERVLSAGWFGWGTALIELANEGRISRDRLIDESLAALRRDFAPGVAQSFTAFHDQVAPTLDEMAARRGEYLALLASPVESTVGFALRHLAALQKAGMVDGQALVEQLGPAVVIRPKGHAKRALALLGKVVGADRALAPDAIDLALDALSHETAEVQGAALKLVDRYADSVRPDQRERLADLIPALDPSLRSQAAELAGAESVEVAPVAVPAVQVPPARVLDPDAIPRLRDALAVEPVADLDELLALASLMLERPDDAREIERFADGVSRLCGEDVPEARSSALMRRVDAEFARWGRGGSVIDAKTAVAVVVHHWLRRRRSLFTMPDARGPRAALGRRLAELCRRAASGRPDVLLSAPTHHGGFIDPVVLVERLEAASQVHDYDLAQALLRMAPQRHDEALAKAEAVKGEAGAAICAALGGDARAPRFRPRFPASWDTVAVLAAPDSVEVEERPAKEQPWSYSQVKVKPAPPVSPARLLGNYESIWGLGFDHGMQRWLALVWPGQRELYYEIALRVFIDETLWVSTADRETVGAALEAMLDPDEPLGPNAYRLLAEALGAGDKDRLLGADVVVEAIRSRRLVADQLGREIGQAMLRASAVADRWGASLGSVADYGPLHAYELQRVLESALGSLGDAQPRMTKVLDLLRRLAQEADARVSDEHARAWLERLSARSKSGQLARAALSVTGDGGARSVEAAAAADEAERDRALRWQSKA